MKLTQIFGALGLAMTLMVASQSHAGTRVLSFDQDASGVDIAHGQIIDDEYSAWGVSIYGCNTNGQAGAGTNRQLGICGDDADNIQIGFDTTIDKAETSDDDLLWGDDKEWLWEGESPGNVLILHEHPNGAKDEFGNFIDPDDEGTQPAGFFVFEFDKPVDILSLDVFDIESNEADLNVNNTFYFYIDQGIGRDFENLSFDAGTDVSEKIAFTGDNEYKRMEFGITNVRRLVVNMPGSGAINNLAFKATEVNTPTAFGILLSALLLICAKRRN